MTTAAAIGVGAMGKKPSEMIEVIQLLVRGAGDKKGDDASDSEYIDEQWWGTEDVDEEANGGRRGDDP